jgi:hypothetical protein
MIVDVQYTPEFRASRPRQLLEWPHDAGAGRNFDISPDGKSFVTVRSDEGAAQGQLRLVLNWLQDLTARK